MIVRERGSVGYCADTLSVFLSESNKPRSREMGHQIKLDHTGQFEPNGGSLVLPRANDRFEVNDDTGARLLTADGCGKRHQRPKQEQFMTKRESVVREFSGRNAMDWADGQLCEMVAILQQRGIPLVEPTLEEYVSNNVEILQDYEQYKGDEIDRVLIMLYRRG